MKTSASTRSSFIIPTNAPATAAHVNASMTCARATPLVCCAPAAATMKFVLYILLIALIFTAIGAHRSVKHSRSPREKQFIMRTTLAAWLLGFLILAAVVFLPTRLIVLLMLPIAAVALSLARAWQNTRTRLREERAAAMDFERMKRVG